MYAVVKTGGKQVKLEKGTTEAIEKLDAAVGSTVTFTPIFIADGEKALVGAEASSAVVSAEIVEHFKDAKVVIFKFKKRKGYKVKKGHRQQKTLIRVTDISMEAPKGAKAAATKPAARPAPKKPAAKPAAPAKKAAATKAPAAKRPAAKKPAAKKQTPAESAE